MYLPDMYLIRLEGTYHGINQFSVTVSTPYSIDEVTNICRKTKNRNVAI